MEKQAAQVKLGRLEEKAIASAQKNGGILTRRPDGFWQGGETDPTRHPCESVMKLAAAHRLVFTKDREGTKIHIEGKLA